MKDLESPISAAQISQNATLAEIVRQRALDDGNRTAYTFLADGAADARSMTWSQLDERAHALGAVLSGKGATGQSVLLALPSGLSFVESLFACWYAGAVAVPINLPRHRGAKHRLHQIIADAGARFIIGSPATRERLAAGSDDKSVTDGLIWVDSDRLVEPPSHSPHLRFPGQDVALLQYTSGSTGAPRGVMVTHANLIRNSALIAEACGHGPSDTIAGWLPLFHDMGLVGLILQAAYSGARCVFMPPERFLMRPLQWLRMISDYAVCSSPAPNFAYDLCVDKISADQKIHLNLSSWRNALNGSEPVRASTLHRFAAAFASCGFRRDALFPCYGLAEATLFVTGPAQRRRLVCRTSAGALLVDGDSGGHVGCGQAYGDTQLSIVDPKRKQQVPPGTIGEIWVAGASRALGYWNNAEATAATFMARLEDTAALADGGHFWLRTGDLGFIADGELFITGRLRELIIISGRNLFPVDLERTVEATDSALAASSAAAFSVDSNGLEQLIILVEMRRSFRGQARENGLLEINVDALCRRLRAALVAEYDIAPNDIVLLYPGGLPRTTNGKISRQAAREAYLARTLDRLEGSPHATIT